MNIWLSKIALREWTGPKVRLWFAIKLSRNQFHLLWIIQGLMEWEMAKRAWVMRWSDGCALVWVSLCPCMCLHAYVCVGGGGEMGGYITQNESRVQQCGAQWLGKYCHFTCTAGVACQWGVCVCNLLITVGPVEIYEISWLVRVLLNWFIAFFLQEFE